MVAAVTLADQGFPVDLAEITDQLGGNALKLRETWKGENIGQFVEQLVNRVQEHEKITVHFKSKVSGNAGFVGNFETILENVEDSSQKTTVQHGVTVISTGGKPFQPTEYLYGEDDRVFTHLDFDLQLKENGAAIKKADKAVFVQCVGSREPERPYCSKVCCTHSMESALRLKELNPEMAVYILYRDVLTYGFREDL